ncbi:DENN domain-containing protein 1B [Triplophysa tibetana]|uniref:DENN domain-containing protein 1B n=1 Tax=Triplophysa tibetana TaxID=1572043 RepID=A0A5A9PI82_9TELE|nr:DENN domain-containing protein 1B [Triplophysa tibetana]
MGSRIKKNPDKTFYWLFQASSPIARDKDPDVLYQFPEDFSDEESLKFLPRFCFPYDIESYLPWFEVFYKLLNSLADYMTKGQTKEMTELLSLLHNHPVPPAIGSITLQMVHVFFTEGGKLQIRSLMPGICGHTPKGEESDGIPYFIAPDPKALPSIPENRNLTELVVAVDVGNLLQLYASMLFERRILIYCSKLSTLTACVHACNGMLFPMYWQHIFIPVLPPHLLDYCCAPMPYLIGVHSSLAERVKSRALEDVVILNVDTNTLESPYQDLKKIPADVVAGLKVRLKKQAALVGSGVSRAFLRSQALLFGGYRDALQCVDEGPVVFCKELFLNHKSQSMKEFLESAVHLQCFKEFIDGRLEMLNKGKEPDDVFEEEVLHFGSSSAGSNLCRHLVGNLKTKYHNKFGLKNLLSSKGHTESHMLQRGGSVCGPHTYRLIQSDSLQNRLPITQHFGRSRPRRPARKHPAKHNDQKTQDTHHSICDDGATEEPDQCSGYSELPEDDDLSLMSDTEEMDLLGEIFDTLNTQSSREPGLLYSTRSLDVFGSDNSEFISRRSLAAPSQESLSPSVENSESLTSWEEELEEGPGDQRQESEILIDLPEKSKSSFKELEESLCSDVQSLGDASLDLKVDGKEEPLWLTQDGVNGTVDECEESLDTGTVIGEKPVENKFQSVNEEETEDDVDEHHNEDLRTSEHSEAKQKPFQEATTERIISPVSVNVEKRSDKTTGELKVEHPSPSTSASVALFQREVSRSRSSTDSSLPGTSFRGQESSQETALRSHKVHVASRMPAAGTHTDEQSSRPPPIQLLDEEQDKPPVKVSELKKRFEY